MSIHTHMQCTTCVWGFFLHCNI